MNARSTCKRSLDHGRECAWPTIASVRDYGSAIPICWRASRLAPTPLKLRKPHSRGMTESLRTDLNGFLFTPIASDANGMHLTMLSALARSGVDPWVEAAGLAALPEENATQKLVLMLADVPNGPSPGDDTEILAARLVAQLHSSPSLKLTPTIPPVAATQRVEAPTSSFATLPRRVRLAIYSVVALIFMVVGYRALAGAEAATPTGIGYQQTR